jgi:hypothetical protein
MARKVVVAGALAPFLVLALTATPASAILPLEAFGLPGPTDVVWLLDSLTRKDSTTRMEVKLGATVGQGKLLVARTRVEVVMERSSRNWRGCVTVHMTVPTAITYSVNLAAIRPEHVRPDAHHGVLVVVMPTPQVEEVTPLLAELKTDNTFGKCRFRRW